LLPISALHIGDALPYKNRGAAYQRKGDYDDNYERALADFNRAIAIDTVYLTAFVGRRRTYQAMGEREKAIEDCKKLWRSPPWIGRPGISRPKQQST
jgi:tetratricopeptide (TPR) repeat protein